MGGYIYGLALVLVIFGGIIIQCEGTVGTRNVGSADSATLSNQKQNEPIFDTKEDQIRLSNDLIENIVSESISGTVPANDNVIGKILQHHIIQIAKGMKSNIYEYYKDGDLFLNLGKYETLKLFLTNFGDKVKKIDYWYCYGNGIPENIIRKHADTLEEVRIFPYTDLTYWDYTLRGKNDIQFLKVKRFQLGGANTRIELDLKSIFPYLESLDLSGLKGHVECLANITELNELALPSISIEEDQLVSIFENNKNLKMIRLFTPNSLETMQSIATHLTQLETLEVECPDEKFLFEKTHWEKLVDFELRNTKPVLQTVKHFNIRFDKMYKPIRKHSFNMPKLQKLTLNGNQTDNGIFDFINNFNGVDKVELFVKNFDTLECIKKLKKVRECVTVFSADRNIQSVVYMLKNNFDTNSELRTLKFVNLDDAYFCENFYKKAMVGINDYIIQKYNEKLKGNSKVSWTLSHEHEIGRREKVLVFRCVDKPAAASLA